MPTPAPPSLVLFDLDGVLVEYSHARRMAHMGAALDRDPADIFAALFESGLEARYDAGLLTTDAYLAELGAMLGCTVDAATWSAARIASRGRAAADRPAGSESTMSLPPGRNPF